MIRRVLVRPVAAALLLLFCVAAAPASTPGTGRIVTLGGDVTEIVYALGQGSRIACDDISSLYPEPAKALRHVGYYRTVSAEGVLSCRPDAVLASSASGPPAAMAQLAGSGVRMTHVPDRRDPAEVADKIGLIAAALGIPDRGADLVARYRAELAAALAGVRAHAARPRVIFLMAQGPGGEMVAGRDTAADEMIGLSGGENAAHAFAGYRPLTPEAALALRPDVILVADFAARAMGGLDALRARPEVGATPAGRSGRLHAVDGLLVLGFGPRLPEAIRTLDGLLHGA